MEILFLGTGGAWGIPEINCNCYICQELRKKGEKRDRTSIMISGEENLLIDCGPDAKSQLARNQVCKIDAVLITHEHGDHFIGLDELFAYKRNSPREHYHTVPVYLTGESWATISPRFKYLEDLQVLNFIKVNAGRWFSKGAFEILPFGTEHGVFAKGSVGYLIRFKDGWGSYTTILYTSDFMDIPRISGEILNPDYLIIQSFWLNEPVSNRPHHMSFQRAIEFIQILDPVKETFLVHMGDADMVPGDPANINAKKYEPKDPMRPPHGRDPYPIPLNHEQWQMTVNRVLSDRGLQYKITVAHDDLRICL